MKRKENTKQVLNYIVCNSYNGNIPITWYTSFILLEGKKDKPKMTIHIMYEFTQNLN